MIIETANYLVKTQQMVLSFVTMHLEVNHMFLKQGNVKNKSSHVDPEKQWREKLLGECQEEFFETFGQYDGKFEHPALYYWPIFV